MNLKSGQRRFRVFLEEGATGRGDDAWRYYELHGRCGRIWSYSETVLAMLVLSNRIGERVKRDRPDWKLFQNCENEMCFLVPDKELDEAAKVIFAKKRRYLNPEMKKKSIQTLKNYRLRSSPK